jgi:bifunctional non-homologous end joining protein LigD
MDRSTRASSPFGSTPAERDGKLRHPRFRGLRTDKAAFEVVRETR